MILRRNFKIYLIITLALFQAISVFNIKSTPINNNADSCPIYNTAGTDKFYKQIPHTFLLSLDLSPYYQSANGCRNKNGNKVPLGDMYGQWNMLSTFFDISKMTPKTFSPTNYPNLWATNNALLNVNNVDYTNPANYHPDYPNSYSGEISTDVANFDNTSIYQAAGKYEKLGLRGKFAFDTKLGLGVSVRTGVADYKIRPRFVALAPNTEGKTYPPDTEPSETFYNQLLQESARNNIFKDLSFDITEVRETKMEDTHVQIYWHIPFHINEDEETVVTIAPYLAVGGWLASGNKKDYTRAFDMSTGNNGHPGITAEGSLNFDFPGTIQLSLGGGVLWLDDEDFNTYRMPSNQYQSGYYAWTTEVNVDPGLTWYFNGSFKAANFMSVMPGFSFYFDFVYTYHEHDDYTIKDSSLKREALFESCLEKMQTHSSWKSQIVDFGISYDVANHLTLGFAVQAPISGIKVFRSVTSMGTVSIYF